MPNDPRAAVSLVAAQAFSLVVAQAFSLVVAQHAAPLQSNTLLVRAVFAVFFSHFKTLGKKAD